MARNFRSARRAPLVVAGRRRESLWIGSAFITALTAIPANSALLVRILSAGALALRPFTIIRTVGLLSVRSDQVSATEGPQGGIGQAVVSDQASAIGITAVPDPVTDVSSDLWFQYQAWATDIINVSSVGVQAPTFSHFAFDSRAMRKVEDGQDAIQVIANGSAAFGAEFIWNQRLLVKLH